MDWWRRSRPCLVLLAEPFHVLGVGREVRRTFGRPDEMFDPGKKRTFRRLKLFVFQRLFHEAKHGLLGRGALTVGQVLVAALRSASLPAWGLTSDIGIRTSEFE